MLKLQRLTIHRLARVRPGTELVFNDGVNVLLGVNGTGKTTLLNLLEQILGGDPDELAEDMHLACVLANNGDRFEVDLQTRPGRARKAAARRRSITVDALLALAGRPPVRVVIRDDRATASQDDRILFEGAPGDLDLGVLFAPAAALVESGVWDPSTIARIPGSNMITPVRLDEANEWFEEITDDDLAFVLDPAPDDVASEAADYLPLAVITAIHGQIADDPARDGFRVESQQWPYLADIAAALGMQDATLTVDVARIDHDPKTDTSTHALGNLRLYFTKADGSRLRHDQLSFGQRRLLAFFYYAALYPDILIADELTNGMHHAMIERCIDLIGARQAFLATQNPLLLDNLGFESADEVRRTFILCTTDVEDGRERMVWRNMSVAEADDFYRDYKVGISHVNDILRSRGLW